ncbi:FadR/GntR family transcriptional regulator [Herbiconiux sp. YIM B11900]|uniref:FadR/GntR family transcriptional regulator n=1 Tax=Herbiconiux sp. YIM B11900 TaxID=3404131 RepID=UPI003F8691A5
MTTDHGKLLMENSSDPTNQVFRHARRSFDDIVAQIQHAIDQGTYRGGERLPAERELMQVFGASRGTVREALRLLEGMDRVTIRRGAHGGVFVKDPDALGVASALESLIRFRRAGVSELVEFRPEFEADNARWAARRATPEQVQSLRRVVEAYSVQKSGEWSVLVELDLEFHQVVAAASGNEIRAAISLGMNRIVRGASLALESTSVDRDDEARQLGDVVDAIADGDPERAHAAMLRHVNVNSAMELRAEEPRQ